MAEQETKQELIEAAKKLGPPAERFSLEPRTFDEAFRFANLIAESTLIPKEFQKQPANVLLAVQLGMELGVSPMQSLQNMYVINGRPAIYGDLPLAIVYRSGLLEEIQEQATETSATCSVKRRNMPAISRSFTMADAEKAGLPARNPTYKSYPKRMLQLRARSIALRDGFADVLKGVQIAEEHEENEARDITNEPLKMPEEVKSDQTNAGNSEAGPGDQQSPVADSYLAAKRTRIKAREAGQDSDPEQDALNWCRVTEDADFYDQHKHYLATHLKGMNQDAQLRVLKAFNDRTQKIVGEMKQASKNE